MDYYERLNIKDIFQEEVFTDEVMQRYMSEDAYRALKDVIARGDELPRSLADEVAAAMKTWAVEKGATHFTHWFQPMTEYTAEKHDSFISVDKDGKEFRRVLFRSIKTERFFWNFRAKVFQRAKRTRRVSRRAESAPRSRRAATPCGIAVPRRLSSVQRAARAYCAYRRRFAPTPVRRLIKKPRSFAV